MRITKGGCNLALALFIVAIIIAGGASAQQLTKPEYAVGDYWVYAIEGPAGAPESKSGTIRTEITAAGDLEINGTTEAVLTIETTYEEFANADLYTAVTQLNSTEFLRISDYAPVLSIIDFSLSVPAFNISQTVIATTEYLTRVPLFAYPISPGMSWNTTNVLESTSEDEVRVENDVRFFTCTGTETITVPAGTASCLVIEERQGSPTSNNYTKTYYTDAVGGELAFVKQTTYSGGLDAGSFVLESFSYVAGALLDQPSSDDASRGLPGFGVAVLGVLFAVVALALVRRR